MKCQICGCTDKKACPGGCFWIMSEICSNCIRKIPLAIYIGPTNVRGRDKYRFECSYCKFRFNRSKKNIQKVIFFSSFKNKVSGLTTCPHCKKYVVLKIGRGGKVGKKNR